MIDMMTSIFFLSSISYFIKQYTFITCICFFLVSHLIVTAKACSIYDIFLKPGTLLTNTLFKLIVRPLLFIELSKDVLFSWLRQIAHGRGYWWCSLLHGKWSCFTFFRGPCLLCLCWLLIYNTVFIASFHDSKEVMKLMYIILYILAVRYLIGKKHWDFFISHFDELKSLKR